MQGFCKSRENEKIKMDPSNNLQAQKSPLGVKEPDQGQLYEAFEFAPDNKPIKSLEVLNF